MGIPIRRNGEGYAKVSRKALNDPRLRHSAIRVYCVLEGMANYSQHAKVINSRHPNAPTKLIPRGSGYFSQVNTLSDFSPKTVRRCLLELAQLGYITYQASWEGTTFTVLDYDAVMLGKKSQLLNSLSYNQQYLINPHSKRPPPVRFFGSKGAGPPDWEMSKRHMAAFESAKVATSIPDDALKLLNMWRRK